MLRTPDQIFYLTYADVQALIDKANDCADRFFALWHAEQDTLECDIFLQTKTVSIRPPQR